MRLKNGQLAYWYCVQSFHSEKSVIYSTQCIVYIQLSSLMTFHVANHVMLTASVCVLLTSGQKLLNLNYHFKYLNWYLKTGLHWKGLDKVTTQITESQSWLKLGQNSRDCLAQTHHTKQLFKSCVHLSFNCLQGWRLHNQLQYSITLKIQGIK